VTIWPPMWLGHHRRCQVCRRRAPTPARSAVT